MEMSSSIKLANCYFYRLMLFIQKLQVSFGVLYPGDKSTSHLQTGVAFPDDGL